MKIYLSGPMTGLPELNYPAFMAAAAELRGLGHEVFDPAEWEKQHNDGHFNLLLAFEDYCRYIIREADCVVVLPGWESSPGATAEAYLAKAIKKAVHNFQSFIKYRGHENGNEGTEA